jgi:hypothetical protein
MRAGQRPQGHRDPVKVGAIATQMPGIDFTDGPAMAKDGRQLLHH